MSEIERTIPIPGREEKLLSNMVGSGRLLHGQAYADGVIGVHPLSGTLSCQYHLISSPFGRGWVRVRSLAGGPSRHLVPLYRVTVRREQLLWYNGPHAKRVN
jgi:hypothetical protein